MRYATQEEIDSIQVPERLALFHVITPGYESGFKPLQGKLRAVYNGTRIDIQVDKTDILCHLASLDAGCFGFKIEVVEPALHSWADICYTVAARTNMFLHHTAVGQKLELAERGIYYVQ